MTTSSLLGCPLGRPTLQTGPLNSRVGYILYYIKNALKNAVYKTHLLQPNVYAGSKHHAQLTVLMDSTKNTKTYYNLQVQICDFFFNKETAMHATTLSFRAGEDLAEQTRALAISMGLKSSDYIRQAVREKNELVMAQRIAALSKTLSAEHRAFNNSLEDSLADGLN